MEDEICNGGSSPLSSRAARRTRTSTSPQDSGVFLFFGSSGIKTKISQKLKLEILYPCYWARQSNLGLINNNYACGHQNLISHRLRNRINKAVAMKGLTLGLLHLHFEFQVWAKILGLGENFVFGQKFWVRAKILGLGENFRFGQKFWVWAKILGLGENFRFGRKFWVRAKILGSGENFRFGRKF